MPMPPTDPQPFDESPTVASEKPRVLGRFRLIREIGAGGMGRVYLADDEELRERVALKLIRLDSVTSDAEERFKREISLARRVTHSNVIRIHDIGVADGTRFISMAFIDGEDLAAITRRGLLPVAQALGILIQICDGLAAAHDAGVIHRDLKPANIMVDRTGRAFIMDFGLAHAAEAPALSAPGTVLGTVDYMSPEQARGEPADNRSDIYAVGVMLFYLLTGRFPFEGDTAMSRLSARLNAPIPSPTALRPELPRGVDTVVQSCLAIDPSARYRSARELRAALASVSVAADGPPLSTRARAGRLATGLLIVAASIAFVLLALPRWRRADPAPTPAWRPTTIAVLPWHNASGDATVDWFGLAMPNAILQTMRDAPGVQVVPLDRVVSILHDLHVAPAALANADTAARLREFTNADVVVAGTFAVGGDRITVDASVHRGDEAAGTRIPTQTATLDEIDAVADRIANSLGGAVRTRPVGNGAPPDKRPAAVRRLYREGVEFVRSGQFEDASKKLLEATTTDDRFAEAWAALALSYRGLRRDRDAASASRHAVDTSGGLPPRKRLEILALNATVQRDNRQAIDAYEQLLKVSPLDDEARLILAGLYESVGSYEASKRAFGEILTRDPRHVQALLGAGRVAIRNGTPADAIEPLSRALSMAVRLDNDTQRAAAQQALGVAYKRLDRPLDALQAYEHALEIRRRLGLKQGVASSLGEIAQIYDTIGKPADAERYYLESIDVERDISDRDGESIVLLNLGSLYFDSGNPRKSIEVTTRALQIARELSNEDREAIALNNIGNAHLDLIDVQAATVFQERSLAIRRRLNLPSLADSVHNLGDIALTIGDYKASTAHLLEALELRRKHNDTLGEAIEQYSLSLVHDSAGRFGAGAAMAGDAQAYRQNEGVWTSLIVARSAGARAGLGECDGRLHAFDDVLARVTVSNRQPARVAVLGERSTAALLCGDTTTATRAADEALALALRTSNKRAAVDATLKVLRARNASAPSAETRSISQRLVADAERNGLQGTAASGLIELAEAENALRNYAAARRAAERALVFADKSESWLRLATANYAMSVALRGLNRPDEAAKALDEAKRWVAEIRREAGTDAVLNRTDLKKIQLSSLKAQVSGLK